MSLGPEFFFFLQCSVGFFSFFLSLHYVCSNTTSDISSLLITPVSSGNFPQSEWNAVLLNASGNFAFEMALVVQL